jgi:hypothetical protein
MPDLLAHEEWEKKAFSWKGKPEETIKFYENDVLLNECEHEQVEVGNVIFPPDCGYPCFEVLKVERDIINKLVVHVCKVYLGG